MFIFLLILSSCVLGHRYKLLEILRCTFKLCQEAPENSYLGMTFSHNYSNTLVNDEMFLLWLWERELLLAMWELRIFSSCPFERSFPQPRAIPLRAYSNQHSDEDLRQTCCSSLAMKNSPSQFIAICALVILAPPVSCLHLLNSRG